MSMLLPPSPNNSPPGSAFWNDWYEKLRSLVNNGQNFLFTNLNFGGSNLTSLATRNHNDLQNIQGGASTDYQHLTTAQVSVLSVKSKAGAPTTTDIPVSTWAIYKDTTLGTVKLYANDGGTIKSVSLI